MCGICGQFNFGDMAPVSLRHIQMMNRTIAHRGPDDEGYHVSGPVGLGFRRLSIIDLAAGHQPMSDREESVWVIFNGEIYNFQELRSELIGKGHVFRTNSDTEVIVHGYKQWGDEVLNRLNGMFGLAIWDQNRNRLLLARDPFGIKPVYYTIDGNRLYFGSEMRPIRMMMSAPDIDPTAINLFLRYRFTPSPYTIFKNVRKLAPGTSLTVQDGSCTVTRWYRYKPTPFTPPKTAGEAYEELLALYKRAIKRQLISDVPVGLLLSGGVDSGLLLALMNLNGRGWPTYTVGYGSTYRDDELADAEHVARILGSNHTSLLITRSAFEDMLSKIVTCLEEPVATSSIVPMYFVCERAREDVKVGLVGQGPDELFGGYRRHLGVRYDYLWTQIPDWMRSVIAYGIHALPRHETLKRGVHSLAIPDRMRRYQHVLSLLPGNQVDALFQSDVLDDNAGDTILDCWADMTELMLSTDELGGLQFLEIRSTLPDELLLYADKLSMAHGLELRVPYIDKEIVEYVERLPANFKVRNGSGKWLHKQVCRNFLPESVVRRRKRGFNCTVVNDWLRTGFQTKMMDTLLESKSRIYQYLREDAVRKLLNDHTAGRHDNHKLLFSLVVLEQWMQTNQSPVPALS
jgi:asparagine synthase (glutamine-hydrolysing)